MLSVVHTVWDLIKKSLIFVWWLRKMYYLCIIKNKTREVIMNEEQNLKDLMLLGVFTAIISVGFLCIYIWGATNYNEQAKQDNETYFECNE